MLLIQELGVKFSETTVRKLMKQYLGLSYKKVYFSQPAANTTEATLKRKFAAHAMVDLLSNGREVINVDESTLNSSNYSKSRWTPIGEHFVSTD